MVTLQLHGGKECGSGTNEKSSGLMLKRQMCFRETEWGRIVSQNFHVDKDFKNHSFAI